MTGVFVTSVVEKENTMIKEGINIIVDIVIIERNAAKKGQLVHRVQPDLVAQDQLAHKVLMGQLLSLEPLVHKAQQEILGYVVRAQREMLV
jgi:hypothetical protein